MKLAASKMEILTYCREHLVNLTVDEVMRYINNELLAKLVLDYIDELGVVEEHIPDAINDLKIKTTTPPIHIHWMIRILYIMICPEYVTCK